MPIEQTVLNALQAKYESELNIIQKKEALINRKILYPDNISIYALESVQYHFNK